MALEIRLSQKLSQSLVMTPQLQQAIRLLQLGREDYLEEMEKALLENPVLEDQREEDRYVPPTPAEQVLTEASTENSSLSNEDSKQIDKNEADFANIFDIYNDSTSTSSYSAKSGDWDDERPSLESMLTARQGLAEHLLWQLRDSELCKKEKEIIALLIGNLDKNGYLAVSLEELCPELGLDLEETAKVLSELQNFDPIGVGARDLKECLLLQLRANGNADGIASKIVEKHLSKLETRKYEAIAKDLGIPIQEVYEAVKLIQKLEPRPGRPFVDEEPIYITPDIFVRKIEGEWKVSLNEAGMPKLRISKSYQELLEKSQAAEAAKSTPKTKAASSPEEREYISERIKSASWLIRSVQQRQQTIHKVAESIMRFQKEFLDLGTTALRPLVLREVADDVEMHESTVSRVTTNKYIHTPHGVYELKFFFSSGLNSEEGGISSESVKEKLRSIIASENQADPLSDQALAAMLKKDGIDIARRTVAKYREMMGILSSTVRKKSF